MTTPATPDVLDVLVENHRRAGTTDANEPGADEELRDEVCACVASLVETLKPEYAAAIKRVDLDGTAVVAFAREAGITANNAGVRLHRAHEALRRQLALTCSTCAAHGCLDCTCGGPSRPQT